MRGGREETREKEVRMGDRRRNSREEEGGGEGEWEKGREKKEDK